MFEEILRNSEKISEKSEKYFYQGGNSDWWYIDTYKTRFAALIESSYSASFLILLGLAMLGISISLLQVF